jgi:hypothetical protein
MQKWALVVGVAFEVSGQRGGRAAGEMLMGQRGLRGESRCINSFKGVGGRRAPEVGRVAGYNSNCCV